MAYGILKLTTKIDNATAAAVAAHYGSISMVTFATASAFLNANQISYGGYIVAVLALMEAPAILSGLLSHTELLLKPEIIITKKKQLSREIFTNGAILLLSGAFIIGCITGQNGMDKVSGFLDSPFQGILCLFYLIWD